MTDQPTRTRRRTRRDTASGASASGTTKATGPTTEPAQNGKPMPAGTVRPPTLAQLDKLVTARNDTTEQLRGIEHAITETARTMIASGRYNGADIARAMGVTRQALNERVRRANGR